MAQPMQNEQPLEVMVGKLLLEKNLTIATAESCTGGLIAARLTDISGSSGYIMGGVVAYSDAVKLQMLGVRETTLHEKGAVSEVVAKQMATGARIMFGTDLAVSVTGIAGPLGGTPAHPVGLTFIGLSTPNGTQVRQFVFDGNRIENKQASADEALRMVLDYLQEA